MKRIAGLVLVLVFVGITGVFASYEDRVALEKSVASKAQHLLDTMYGPHNFSVSVKVDLGVDSWRVKYTERAIIKSKAKKKDGGNDFKLLPGYSAIRNLAPDEQSKLPFNSMIQKIPAKVRRITLDVVVSKSISKKDTRNASKLLIQLLGLNEKRGDAIRFNFQKFKISEKSADQPEDSLALAQEVSRSIEGIQTLITIALALMSFFLLVYIIFQRKLLKKQAASSGGAGGGASAPVPKPSAPQPSVVSGGGSTESSMKRYFDFITSANVLAVSAVLKREKLEMQHVAVILGYLNSEVSASIMSSLSVPDQSTVIAQLSEQKVLEKETLDKLEARVKGRLECMVGGVDSIQVVLSNVSNKAKKGILDVLKQKSPNVYGNIRSSVLLFDDLQKLSVDHLKTLLATVNLEQLSLALLGSSEKTQGYVVDNLSQTAQGMVKQFFELKKGKVDESSVDAAQAEILLIADQMDAAGQLVLKKKLGGAKKAVAPVKKETS